MIYLQIQTFTQNQQYRFLMGRKENKEPEVTVTFCDVPGNATEKDLAGIQRILVVPGWQLTTPGEGGFIHS